MIFVHLGAGAGDLDSGANFRCGVTEFIKKNFSEKHLRQNQLTNPNQK